MVLHMGTVEAGKLHLLGKLLVIAVQANNSHLRLRWKLRLRFLKLRLRLRLLRRGRNRDGDRLDYRVALGLGFGRIVIAETALELGKEPGFFWWLGGSGLLDGLGSGLLLRLCWLSRLLALDRGLDRALGGGSGGDSGGLAGSCDGCDSSGDTVDRRGLGAGLCSWNLSLVHVW